jgi:hypothetical protein
MTKHCDDADFEPSNSEFEAEDDLSSDEEPMHRRVEPNPGSSR